MDDAHPQTPVDKENDPGMQLAPADGDVDLLTLKTGFETTVRDCFSFVSQCRQNYETRFAIWNGQSSDNKKHSREGDNPEPTPWDGASDMRVYEVDHAINYKVALYSMARRKANLMAVPVNAEKIERAKVVGNFMKWLINTQVPEMDREDELLAQYLKEKGVAIMGQFWEVKQEKVLDVIRLKDIQAKFPQQNVWELLNRPELEEHIAAAFMEYWEISAKKAKAMIRQLKKTGEASIPVLGPVKSRPVMRAFNLDEDVFIPPYATDLESAPAIYRMQYYSAEQLRSFAHADGWNRDWVEKAIETCKGKMITLVPDKSLEPIARNYIFRYQRFNDLIGVVYAYRRLSDEDGVPGIYLTIFNPDLPEDTDQPGYAKHGLLGYRHGQYPFVLHRAEYLSRRVHDSRGIPEVGKSFQDNIKAHRDSRMDAASIGILPPVGYPMGRAPGAWGPGARIPERRAGEYHFMDRPSPGGDANTEKSEQVMMAGFREYNGIHTGDEDNQVATVLNQFEVDKYLTGWSKSLLQLWWLWQQYGEDRQFFQIAGLKNSDPLVMQKGDPEECYDFYLTYDTINFDPEARNEMISQIIEIAQTADREGRVDWGELITIAMELKSPSIAERIIQPKQAATQKMVSAIQNDLTQIAGGIDKNITPGTPPQLILQTMQAWGQQPDIAQRLQNEPAFQARAEKYSKQAAFQIMQQMNAMTGKLGTLPAGAGPANS